MTRQLLATFKQLMAQGSLVPGCRLPPERELAKTLGVSRSTLRQALKVLEIMEVISSHVGDGTYLNPGASSVLSEPMEFLILLNEISSHEVMEARLIVEPELAARAAARATAEEVVRLERTLRAMEECAGNRTRLIEQDLLFHQAIFDAAGNRLCSLMFSVLHKSLHELIDLTSRLVDLEHTTGFHRRIFHAIRRRDPEAARRRMTEHLQDVQALLIRASDKAAENQLQEDIGLIAQKFVGAPRALRAPRR